jgi:hypothetical protein
MANTRPIRGSRPCAGLESARKENINTGNPGWYDMPKRGPCLIAWMLLVAKPSSLSNGIFHHAQEVDARFRWIRRNGEQTLNDHTISRAWAKAENTTKN